MIEIKISDELKEHITQCICVFCFIPIKDKWDDARIRNSYQKLKKECKEWADLNKNVTDNNFYGVKRIYMFKNIYLVYDGNREIIKYKIIKSQWQRWFIQE